MIQYNFCLDFVETLPNGLSEILRTVYKALSCATPSFYICSTQNSSATAQQQAMLNFLSILLCMINAQLFIFLIGHSAFN